MENNIIKHSRGVAIFNGGNGLKDCPTDYKQADAWAEQANGEIEGDWEAPMWKWDCGFKLDYDGSLLWVSSRFYPPKTHYGDTWDGRVTINFGEKEIQEKKFDCKTLEELKVAVENYVGEVRAKLEALLVNGI